MEHKKLIIIGGSPGLAISMKGGSHSSHHEFESSPFHTTQMAKFPIYLL